MASFSRPQALTHYQQAVDMKKPEYITFSAARKNYYYVKKKCQPLTVNDYEYAHMSTMTGTEKYGSNPRSITSFFFFAEYNFVFQINNR